VPSRDKGQGTATFPQVGGGDGALLHTNGGRPPPHRDTRLSAAQCGSKEFPQVGSSHTKHVAQTQVDRPNNVEKMATQSGMPRRETVEKWLPTEPFRWAERAEALALLDMTNTTVEFMRIEIKENFSFPPDVWFFVSAGIAVSSCVRWCQEPVLCSGRSLQDASILLYRWLPKQDERHSLHLNSASLHRVVSPNSFDVSVVPTPDFVHLSQTRVQAQLTPVFSWGPEILTSQPMPRTIALFDFGQPLGNVSFSHLTVFESEIERSLVLEV
jgi:hypothetical protein